MNEGERFLTLSKIISKTAVLLVLLIAHPVRADDPPPPPEPEPTATAVMQAPPPPTPLEAAPVSPDANATPAITPEVPEAAAPVAPPPAAPTPETATVPQPAASPALPGITAKISSVTIVKRSASSRVYLVQNQGPTENLPAVGRVVLFKNDEVPVMGGLVLKTFPDKNQFAAKNVRDYGNGSLPMQPDQPFSVLEKLSDYTPSAPVSTAQDKADLKEIAPPAPVADASAAPPASDTDAPPPPGSAPNPTTAMQDDDDDGSDIAIEEIHPIDRFKSWLTAEVGFFRNVDATGTTTNLFAGGGARYGLTLGKQLFFSDAHLQDSIVGEVGIFYYKIVNFATTTGDAYNVIPIIPTVRYNLSFSEEFTLFFYGGVMLNFASGAGNAVAQVTSNLNAPQLAIGTGAEFGLGPNFDARVDLGYDMLGLGLVLRF